jgi:hypothetical protein
VEKWQFNVLFFVGVGGAILLLIGGDIGLEKVQNPGSVGGIGAILTFVLTQRDRIIKPNGKTKSKEGEDDGPD